jgi:adenylate cyclase
MKKYLVFLTIAVAASLIAFSLYRSGFSFIEEVDLRLKDARFRLRGPVAPNSSVVVVAVDNRSVKEIGRWPWSREVTAQLIRSLADYGAKVVAVDMVFSEPQGDAQDRALGRAVASSGNVVMGYFFRNEEQKTDPRALEQIASAKVKLLRIDDGVSAVPLIESPSLDANIPVVGAGALDFGFFNAIPDDDGLFRKAPLLFLYNGDIYPSLGLKALGRYLEREIMVDVAAFGVRSVALGPLSLPVNEQGALSLNYFGPTGSFTTISAADVLAGRISANALKGKLVFLGTTETGIYDMRATPFDPALPGVEIHATVAADALDKRFLVRDGRTYGLEMTCMFILPLLLAGLLSRTPRTLIGLVYFALGCCFYFILNYLLFRHFSLDLSIIFPVVPVVLTYGGAEAYRNLVIEKRGKYLKKAFSSYVSPQLVDEIVKNPERLKLGGEKREVSILFSDIRGFTTLSEAVSPEDLVQLLNEYLSPMTRIILEELGTLDKYIGDAIMAIYNAPLDVAGHATHACSSAVRMLDRLTTLNADFAKRGIPQIDIGIGINTGEAVVGNMGADMRFDYTAIGDNVNLASRLEGLTKQYGAHIIVSDTTREAAGNGFIFREIDLVRVKGKQKPVAVFELLVDNHAIVAPFTEGLGLYRGKSFAEAFGIFSGLAERGDKASVLYAERCREFLKDPPGAEWDGVFVARTK